MGKYTFIAEYKGGTYISQYMADDLYQGIILWAQGLPSKFFRSDKRKKILRTIFNDKDLIMPVPLDNIDNVWSTFFAGNNGRYILLNIVLTETCS